MSFELTISILKFSLYPISFNLSLTTFSLSSGGSQVTPPGPPGSSGGTNVSVIPGGGQQAGGQQSSGTAADQKVPPTFSPRDGNNPMLVAVTSIYNILGI